MTSDYHYSVLLEESIELLKVKPNGIYVDGTFGRGGHAKKILSLLGANGMLIAFDKDLDAINYAKGLFQDERLVLIHDSFANIDEHLAKLNLNQVDGILLDLGVSSPQLDDEGRGFSFRFDSELDMRMDNTQGISASNWINTVDEDVLAKVLWQYGEEKFSRKIARQIAKSRSEKPIITTSQLSEIIAKSIPFKEKGQNPATRSFQAIRIFINNELEDLKTILGKIPKILSVGGRIVAISFHSLEDRIVKKTFSQLTEIKKLPKWVTLQESQELPNYKIVAKKIRASIKEVNENVRSRSAVLRALERLR